MRQYFESAVAFLVCFSLLLGTGRSLKQIHEERTAVLSDSKQQSSSDRITRSAQQRNASEYGLPRSALNWTECNIAMLQKPARHNRSEHISPDMSKFVFQKVISYNLAKIEKCSLLSISQTMPGYEHYIHDDDAARQFMTDYFPHYLSYYDNFTKGVQRADMWRYAMLYTFGGIYADTDVVFYRDMYQCVFYDTWYNLSATPIRMILGIERDYFESELVWRPVEIGIWTIASAPGHYILKRALERVIGAVEYRREHNLTFEPGDERETIELTGPAVFTDAVEDYLRQYNISLTQVWRGNVQIGDVYILPTSGLACESTNRTYSCQGPDACLKHYFRGSWKNVAVDSDDDVIDDDKSASSRVSPALAMSFLIFLLTIFA